jgi:hypothetical protein
LGGAGFAGADGLIEALLAAAFFVFDISLSVWAKPLK